MEKIVEYNINDVELTDCTDTNILNKATVENTVSDAPVVDPEMQAFQARIRENEEELEKLKQLQSGLEYFQHPNGIIEQTVEEKFKIDSRSVYVGNVDYMGTPKELAGHFKDCGAISRITILTNKVTGHPKGYAYIEFAEKEFVEMAVAMDGTSFRNRQIKVSSKRTNRPGMNMTNRFPRRPRGYPRKRGFSRTPYIPRGAYRGRRSNWYSPY